MHDYSEESAAEKEVKTKSEIASGGWWYHLKVVKHSWRHMSESVLSIRS